MEKLKKMTKSKPQLSLAYSWLSWNKIVELQSNEAKYIYTKAET